MISLDRHCLYECDSGLLCNQRNQQMDCFVIVLNALCFSCMIDLFECVAVLGFQQAYRCVMFAFGSTNFKGEKP